MHSINSYYLYYVQRSVTLLCCSLMPIGTKFCSWNIFVWFIPAKSPIVCVLCFSLVSKLCFWMYFSWSVQFPSYSLQHWTCCLCLWFCKYIWSSLKLGSYILCVNVFSTFMMKLYWNWLGKQCSSSVKRHCKCELCIYITSCAMGQYTLMGWSPGWEESIFRWLIFWCISKLGRAVAVVYHILQYVVLCLPLEMLLNFKDVDIIKVLM